MRTNNNSRKKKLLALCLSALMVSSTIAGFAACTDDSTSSSDDSTSSESTKVDTGLVKNADFGTFDKGDGKNLIGTSVTGWTRSVNSASSGSALSSKAASGIIDVSKDAWDDLTKSKVTDAASLSDTDAAAQWENMSAKDKLAFYENWEDREENEDKDLSDLDFYQSFNVDIDDVPTCDNPLTWDYDADAVLDDDVETNVLMIHNQYSNTTYTSLGTAQKYTSSSTVTVEAGTSVQFSVWVKTSDLKSTWTDGTEQDAVNKGAYISVTHTVGGQTLDPLEIKNINTELMSGLEETNGWAKYEFLLQGSTYASTTFTIVLGLGQTGGTDRSEYVNGYAFFDDIECKKITNEKYTELSTASGANYTAVDMTSEQKVFEAQKTTVGKKYALSFHMPFVSTTAFASANWTEDSFKFIDEDGYTAATGNPDGLKTYPGLGLDVTSDKLGVYATPAAMNGSNNTYLQSVYNKHFSGTSDFLTSLADEPVLMLLSAGGAAYTTEELSTVYGIKSDNTTDTTNNLFEIPAGGYRVFSFFVKTSDMKSVTGAGVTLKDGDTENSIASIDTTSVTTVDIDDDNQDIYDGWQQCFFFVANETEEAKSFTLTFTFGPTTVKDTTKSSYESGFAAFTKFTYADLNKEEYACATSGTYSKTVSLTGEQEEETGDSGFDSPAGVPSDAIENGYAVPKNYKGVYSGSAYLGNVGGSTDINTNTANSGLLSKDYLTIEDDDGNEIENAKYTAILDSLLGTNSYATNEEKWSALFADGKQSLIAQQPLVIYNKANEGSVSSYGFLGSSTTISANGYATISLRVKVSEGAKASVYLIDTDDDSFQKTLSVGRTLTYWYDDDGNICAKDPSSSGFKKKDVAFKLQSNGLYRVNTAWSGATGIDADDYYANLGAYTKTDADGNLMVADDGVSYDYNDNWRNEGNDGIAFYKKGDVYYADEACKIPVKDLASVTKASDDDATKPLQARYLAEAAREMKFEIGPTNGEWATVTFYVLAGDTAKNYRLEVWSGDRNGTTTLTDGSYVLFDAYKPSDVTADNFETLIDERKESVTEESYFEGVFSFYDSAKFLRYNASIDENGVGNSYESYLSSAYTSGIAYLKYANATENEYEIYANYSLSEATVTADADDDTDDDTDDEDTTESTTNVWLLASSIAMAAVLLLAIVAVIVRKVVAKSRRKRGYKAITSGSEKKSKKAKKDNK